MIQYKNHSSKDDRKYKYFETSKITFLFPFHFLMKNKQIIKKIILVRCNITNK